MMTIRLMLSIVTILNIFGDIPVFFFLLLFFLFFFFFWGGGGGKQ